MQLSGIGYTFPSKRDKEERKIIASNTAKYMQRSGLRYMEILDSKGFKASVLEDFTAEEAIEGIFYIDCSNYAGEKVRSFGQTTNLPLPLATDFEQEQNPPTELSHVRSTRIQLM